MNNQDSRKSGQVSGFVPIFVVAMLAIVGIVMFMSITSVPTGSIGVVTSFGRPTGDNLPAGIHMIAPWKTVNEVICRNQLMLIATESYTKDIQQVRTQFAVQFNLRPEDAQRLFTEFGPMKTILAILENRFIESTKRVTGQYVAENCVVNRTALKSDIEKQTEIEAKDIAQVVSVDIRDLEFTPIFEKAIEEKQVASQKVQTANYEKARTSVEAETAIIHAKGQAEAVRINAEAIKTNPEVLILEAVRKWDGKAPQSLTIADGKVPAFVNVGK
jgi:regulator of protease activity HflC (stomatin/prohibitin superfamily)